MVGNGTPLQVSATAGHPFVVSARFAARHLSPFAEGGAAVRVVCQVESKGPGGGPAAVVEMRSAGRGWLETATDDCGPCANLGFVADITARSRPRPPSGGG